MGQYFNPPTEEAIIAAGGRTLEGHVYEALTAQLEDSEVLVGLYQRPLFNNAVHLFSPQKFAEFESQARFNIIERLGFFAMPREAIYPG